MDILERNTKGIVTRFRMRKPDDFHHHGRDAEILKLIGPMLAKRFRAAIFMPNLVSPLTSVLELIKYKGRIRSVTPHRFLPLMTFYLTDTLEPAEVRDALSNKIAIGIKFYPPGLTTNSESGVKNPADLWTKGTKPYQCLRELADYGGVFLIHAADGLDKYGNELDPYDQEKHFLKETLPHIIDAHQDLKISVEHLSTAEGADEMRYWGKDRPGLIGCSLTAQHLLLDRRDVFRGGFRPHRHWWPIIQSNEHKQELRKLASEDHPFVWLGSDSAPHPLYKKESDCCAGGVMMVHAGIELYAEAFDEMGALDDRFERFASVNGRKFFGLKGFFGLTDKNPDTIKLAREEWEVKKPFFAGNSENLFDQEEIVPFRLGEKIRWKLVD